MNIKLVKLLNGQDIIADVVEKTDDFVKMKNALRVIIMGASSIDPNTPQVGLAPFSEFSDDKEITLDTNHILCIMNPVEDMTNQYRSIFSGIITPKSSKSNILMPGE